MGWIAIYKNGKIEREEDPGVGRPVQAGENGDLIVIAQEDFGHSVAVDLVNGILALDFDEIGWDAQANSVTLTNVRNFLYIGEGDTNVVGDYKHRHETEPDEQGNYTITYEDLKWRPIWFSRVSNGVAVKVIGAQTTTPSETDINNGKQIGNRNVQKTVALVPDGRMIIC